MDEYNIVIVGVGGQGILFLSHVLGNAALDANMNVRVAEIHGMAQRGGSVICNIRLGDKVYSSTVIEGEADLFIALEPIEALRHIKYANSNTLIVLSKSTIEPPGIHVSNIEYPSLTDIMSELKKISENIILIDSFTIAKQAGNPATQNTVMLGLVSASNTLPIDSSVIKEAIINHTKKKFHKVNLEAFTLGFQKYKEYKNQIIK